jgi:hypothetical protein
VRERDEADRLRDEADRLRADVARRAAGRRAVVFLARLVVAFRAVERLEDPAL